MSVIKATTLSNLAGSKTVPMDTVVDGSAKAWVNFNGTGTVAIRASFNVSSITDNGVGDYTVNFTNALADANYSAAIGQNSTFSGGSIYSFFCALENSASRTSSQFRLTTSNTNGSGGLYSSDYSYISVSVFR